MPQFTDSQFNRLANIFDNAGQVVLGVAVLSPLIGGFNNISYRVVISGVIVIIFCWLASIWLAKKGD